MINATDKSSYSALIVEGGALRGIFSTGVLDGFLERNFNPFDFFMGVSSGATNLAAYLANMPARNYRIYTDYSLRPEFINIGHFFRGGHLLDLDWLWDITIREIRLNLPVIYSRHKPFIVVLTDVQTGLAIYKETAAENLEHVLKASSSMPLFYRTYPLVDGRPTTDGGVADALPIEEAIRRGARKIMVIRSRPQTYRKQDGIADYLLRTLLRKHPLLQAAIANRSVHYNASANVIHKPPAGISIVQICPPDNFRVSRFSKDRLILQEGYEQGLGQVNDTIVKWDNI
jgi:predicted patatin/cPLA2 family phospholipase